MLATLPFPTTMTPQHPRFARKMQKKIRGFSVLSLEELGQLTSVDHYPSEEFVFSSYGCDLHIDNELVANAFAALPKQEQSILILFCVLELGDGEIGDLMGMSRSAVQRHRTKTLNELRKKLKAPLPERG
uniref:sigma-70 family RNA polymerase sigma factor n=1 Tax=Faecalibacterium prausnitzii TaxID=853 RepID=UPI004028281E